MIDTRQPPQPTLGGLFDSEPQRRLFLGLWPDAPAAERLAQLMARLRRDEIMPGRPVDVDRLHLTLHHLGDFDDQIPPSLIPSASAAAASVATEPFEIVFNRVGGTRGQLLLRVAEELDQKPHGIPAVAHDCPNQGGPASPDRFGLQSAYHAIL